MHLSAEDVPEQHHIFKMNTTELRMKGRMCEWFLHAKQNLKHRLICTKRRGATRASRSMRRTWSFLGLACGALSCSVKRTQASTHPWGPRRTTKASTAVLRLSKTFLRAAGQVSRLPRARLPSRHSTQRKRQALLRRHPRSLCGVNATEHKGTAVRAAAAACLMTMPPSAAARGLAPTVLDKGHQPRPHLRSQPAPSACPPTSTSEQKAWSQPSTAPLRAARASGDGRSQTRRCEVSIQRIPFVSTA